MNKEEKRVFKVLCFFVIRLIHTVSYMLIYGKEGIVKDIFNSGSYDRELFDDATLKAIDTLQEYIDDNSGN